MKGFTTALALLAATTYAATVSLETTQCLQTIPLEKFDIEIGKLVVKELSSVCGLKIASATIDVNSLSCRAFRDTAGQTPGSAVFNFTTPALIGTNPRQIRSMRCDVNGSNNGTTTGTGVPGPSSTAGSGSGGNSTVAIPTLSTQTPTGNPTSPTGAQTLAPTGAAETMGLSIGAVVAAGIVYLV